MPYSIQFPSSLSEEEKSLKESFEQLKKVKKFYSAYCSKKQEGDVKQPVKHSLEDAHVNTEEAKRLVKSGVMTIQKNEEKHTFKRSNLLDRKLKEEKESAIKYQPYSSMFGSFAGGGPGTSQERNRNSAGFYGGSPQRRVAVESSRTVTVRGCDLTDNSLRRTFNTCGSIQQLQIDDRKKTATLTFDALESAEKCVKEMDGGMINGFTMRVNFAPNWQPSSVKSQPAPWSDIAANRSKFNDQPNGEENRDMVSYHDSDDIF